MSQAPDRRLHPLSLLFEIGAGLWRFAIPLLATLFATRSNPYQEIVPAIFGLLAIGSAVAKYFSLTYRYGDEDLVVRTGLLFKNERHIPYNRIQNIDAVQNVAHRFLGVALVQVQTGSSSEPEATFNFLRLGELAEMRRRVIAYRTESSSAEAVAEVAAAEPLAKPAPVPLLQLTPRELVIAGFIENRGMALVIAAMGLLFQFDSGESLVRKVLPEEPPEWLQQAHEPSSFGSSIALGLVILALAAVLFVRVLSTAWAVIRLYDFTLVRDGDDLRAEYGLFTRVTATIPVRRVQTISVHQRWLHRKFGRAAIRVTTAGASGVPGESKTAADREWLAPIINVGEVGRLIREIDPTLELQGADWTGAHPRASWRMMRVSALWAVVLVVPMAFFIHWWALVPAALLLVRAVLRARGVARNLGCAIVGDRVAFRSGWLHSVVTVTPFARIQAATCHQSIFDRRTRMASVGVDTAGMGAPGLSMPYLPHEVALRLQSRLARGAAAAPFTW